MEKIKLTLEPREIVGKKVKRLRKEGIIPGNIFGRGLKSINIQVGEKDLKKVYKEAGETVIIEAKLDSQTYPVLISNLQREPVSGNIIHVDFHKVNLKEKIVTHVPIKLTGESPAEKSGEGLVLQTLSELEIESLPTDIPHEILVDISKLEHIGQSIQVKDLSVDREKCEIKNESDTVVVTVQPAEMKEESVEEAAPTEPEAIAEKGEEEESGEGKETESERPEKSQE